MCLPFPDLASRTQGTGEHAGYTWEIVANAGGHRCGYVRVYPGHPWFDKHYDNIDAEVHGGLTFADPGKACDTHDEKAEWWVGFDCAHGGDAPDPSLAQSRGMNPMRMFLEGGYGEHVWTQDEVIAECQSLAEQAANAAAA